MSIFMEHPEARGEVADSQHRGWIDVDDICFSTRRRITSDTATRNDRESANAEISDLVLSRRIDSASPYLFIASCCGRGQTVTVELSKTGSGAGSDTYMTYTLYNALVSSYEADAHAQDTIRPTELVTLSFVEMEVKYPPYDENTMSSNRLLPRLINLIILVVGLFYCGALAFMAFTTRNSFQGLSTDIYGADAPLMDSYFLEGLATPAAGAVFGLIFLLLLAKEFCITNIRRRLIVNASAFVALAAVAVLAVYLFSAPTIADKRADAPMAGEIGPEMSS